MYRKLWSKKLNNYVYNDDSYNYIECNRLNLLIGPNNSGKSRFARALITSDDDELLIYDEKTASQLINQYRFILDLYQDNIMEHGINGSTLQSFIKGQLFSKTDINKIFSSIRNLIIEASDRSRDRSGGPYPHIYPAVQSYVRTGGYEIPKEKLLIKSSNQYYIPILRGMRPLITSDDAYLERTVKDYFPSAQDNLKIITGHDIYQLLASHLLGKPEQREKIKKYEKLLSSEFFNGEEVTLIPEYGKDTVAVKLGSADQFPIYDLGDGLQQIIIITSAAYLNSKDSIITIEEPEISLHPGFLRQLALFLLNHTNHTYFITTHSNSLIDLAELNDSITISRFKRDSESNKFLIKNGFKDRELLFDLGVRASSLYLSNATIWVEGITDRIYIKSFMENYINYAADDEKEELQSYIENYHYSFVEYQGGTLGHWCFTDDGESSEGRLNALRTASNILLLVDGDIKSKGNRLSILQNEFEDKLIVMPGKEIENLLPESILLKTAIEIYRKKRTKIKGDNIENELKELNYSTYKNSPQGIGYHLDKSLGLKGKGKDTQKIFADDSGTIKDKVNFALKATEIMNNTTWKLTPEISSLCERIFSHIKKSNE
ncbi:AAA family ATPase [Aeromonas veronii]|uniref:AAA family ATPase n=1 Tax=Aeromonas veronii TaxID=654 RepID=UPI002714AB4D|nr:ATP-binding protein [Aeromonas veronii]WLD21902.1 ATP-binding protein [Aeromonas veronii]